MVGASDRNFSGTTVQYKKKGFAACYTEQLVFSSLYWHFDDFKNKTKHAHTQATNSIFMGFSLLPHQIDVFQIWKAIIFHQKLQAPMKDKILFTLVVPNVEDLEAFYSTSQSPFLSLTTVVCSDYLKRISKATEIHFRGYQQGADW